MFQLTLCILKPDVVRSPLLFNVGGNFVYVCYILFCLFLLDDNRINPSTSIYFHQK